MAQTIQLKRRIGGAATMTGVDLEEGEPAFNDNGETLWIGGEDGDVNHLLVGSDRQIEITGTQIVTTGAGNAKTFDTTNLKLTGGTAGNIITRGTNDGDLVWAAAPSTEVILAANSGLTGTGVTGDGLAVAFATVTETETGTELYKAVTPAGLRAVTGDPTDLPGSTTTIVEAFEYLETLISALQGAITLQGTWNADDDEITPSVASGITADAPLPAAAAGNLGWYLIVDTAGTIAAGHNAPAGNYAVGDWILSNGSEWLHFAMNFGVIAAVNVTFAPPSGMTASNVQTAIAELHTSLSSGDLTQTIHVDGVSITGDGKTAGTHLTVDTIDGGTF